MNDHKTNLFQRIPYGKTTLKKALEFLAKHQESPEEWNATKIALTYKLEDKNTGKRFMYILCSINLDILFRLNRQQSLHQLIKYWLSFQKYFERYLYYILCKNFIIMEYVRTMIRDAPKN